MKKIIRLFTLISLICSFAGCKANIASPSEAETTKTDQSKPEEKLENPNEFKLELESESIKLSWTNNDSDAIYLIHKYDEEGNADCLVPAGKTETSIIDSDVESGLTYNYVLIKLKVVENETSRAALTNEEILDCIANMSSVEYEGFLKCLSEKLGWIFISSINNEEVDNLYVCNTTTIAAEINNKKLTSHLVKDMALKVVEKNNSAIISWSPVKSAQYYYLYRIESNGSCKFLNSFTNDKPLIYVDKDVYNKDYRYLLTSVSSCVDTMARAALTNEELVEAISNMSIQQFNDLQKALEEKIGKNIMLFTNSDVLTSNTYLNVEKGFMFSSSYVDITLKNIKGLDVVLNSYNPDDRDILIDSLTSFLLLSLEDAEELVDNVPSVIANNLKGEDADKLITVLNKTGRDFEKKEKGFIEDTSEKYSVVLHSYDEYNKAKVILILSEYMELSNTEAEEILNNLPYTIKEDITKENAKNIIKTLRSNGGECSVASNQFILNITEDNIYKKTGYYTVILQGFDAAQKIPVIKVTREITGLGLGEAKALVESAPQVLREKVSYEEAEMIAEKIKNAGGTTTIIRYTSK